jgi:hypothetical protein
MVLLLILASGCSGPEEETLPDRETAIPAGAVKIAGVVNTAGNEGWPFVSRDGTELWFTRTHQGSPAIFLSVTHNGGWQEPVLVISQFAAEPTLDNEGNVYFTHHFFSDGEMIEADIYVEYRK